MTSASETTAGTRNCVDCKHCVSADVKNNIYGCNSWKCEFEPKISAEDKLDRIREILDKAPNTLYFRMIREVVEDGNDDKQQH